MTGIEGIVIGYDGSPGSHEALRWAVWEAEARRAKLTVCLAWAPHYLEVLSEERVYDLARRRAEEILEGGLQYPKSILGPGRVVPVLARRPAGELLCEQSRTAELVAVGSHGHGGIPGLHLGSVAWQLACRGHGPVVIVRGQWLHPNQNPGPVVAGVDGSPASHAVLEFAFREAELRDAPLLAVCAQMDAPGIFGNAHRIAEDFSDAMNGQEKEHPGVAVTRQLEVGSPRAALLTASADAQLLVVGSRGRGGLDDMNLGSVAVAMAHYAPCPIAVIRPRDASNLLQRPKGVTAVPAASASSATASSSRPITAGRHVASANRQAASTFGTIEPGGEPHAP